MERVPILSDPVKDRPQFVVLVDERPWVYSIHVSKYDAVHNAKFANGVVAPIDWLGEEMILPVVKPVRK
jgi:hypothetical protein